jgi:hypothetical protein
MKVARGTIVDASIINAPSSTRNKGSRYHTLSDEERSHNRNKSRERSKVGTHLPCHETSVWLYQGALSRVEIERALSVCELCLDQSGDGKETIIAAITGGVCLKNTRMVQYESS